MQASDLNSTTRLVKEICQLSYDARNYTLLNHDIQLLSKKHGQLKAAIQTMVEQAMEWLPEIKEREGVEKWLELMETLRSVTEGKVRIHLSRKPHRMHTHPSARSSWRLHGLASPSSLHTTMSCSRTIPLPLQPPARKLSRRRRICCQNCK